MRPKPSTNSLVNKCLVAVAVILAAAVLAPGGQSANADLVSLWEANGNANDSVGSNNGTLQNVSFTSGKFGQAFQFDTPTSSVVIPNSSTLNLGSQWSLSAWVYTTSLTGHLAGGQGIVSEIGNSTGLRGYQLSIIDGTGAVWLGFNTAIQGWPSNVISGGTVSTNQWTLITATYDDSYEKLYLNGGLVASLYNPGQNPINSSANFRIGPDDNLNCPFSGAIDEVAVYNNALSASDVENLYNASSVPEPCTMLLFGSGLVGLAVYRKKSR